MKPNDDPSTDDFLCTSSPTLLLTAGSIPDNIPGRTTLPLVILYNLLRLFSYVLIPAR